MIQRFLLLVLLPLCLMTSPCVPSVSQAQSRETRTEYGETTRVIALGAPIVEILYGLGLEKTLIGRTQWTNFPPSVRSVPSVGDAETPNIEAILKLKPDLIIADAHFASLKSRLEKHNIKTILVETYSPQGARSTTETIGTLFGRDQQAMNFIEAGIETPRRVVAKRLEGLPVEGRPRALVVAGSGGTLFSFSHASGRTTLEDAGAINIAADFNVPYPVLSREWIARIKPDLIVYVPEEPLIVSNNYLELSAKSFTDGKLAKRFIVMDGPVTYGPRSEWGTLFLAATLYPERFKDIDPFELYKSYLETTFQSYLPGPVLYP